MFSDYKEDETIDDIQNYTLQQLASEGKIKCARSKCLRRVMDYYNLSHILRLLLQTW
jgi:hypothetical protein